jgi:protein ImuB
MPLAEATALAAYASAPALHLEVADPLADRLALEELAGWCQRFSPTVGLEEAEEPQSLLLDVTGLGPLVGGEQTLARTVVAEFGKRGLTARVAIADTLSAAWALAHFAALEPADDSTRRSGLVLTSAPQPGRSGICLTSAPQADPVRLKPDLPDCTALEPAGEERDSEVPDSTALDATAILSLVRVPLVVSEGQAWAALEPLPVEALRLPAETCALLADLGLLRIDQVAALERATLLARFGAVLLTQLDRARGVAAEAIVACHPPAEWKFEWPLEHPTARREMIEFALDEVLARACRALAREGLGVLRLACRFEHENHPADQFIVGLYRPSACHRHVGELARLKLERLRFREPVAAMSATVLARDRLEFFQQELFSEPGQQPGHQDARSLAALVDRLSNRLGPAAVARPWLLAEAQPEFACQYQPLCGLAASRPGRGPRRAPKRASDVSLRASNKMASERGTVPFCSRPSSGWCPTAKSGQSPAILLDALNASTAPGPGDRPLHLEPRPRPLVVVSVAPEGPPMKFRLSGQDERVVRVWGPERIETGWWRTRLVRRDYYQVETARGTRYWLFRELSSGAWFLHGEFA